MLFFSDECWIYASGKMSNSVFWSKKHPHFYEQVENHSPTVMVWTAMCAEDLEGPYFIDVHMNATKYFVIFFVLTFYPSYNNEEFWESSIYSKVGHHHLIRLFTLVSFLTSTFWLMVWKIWPYSMASQESIPDICALGHFEAKRFSLKSFECRRT